jgi:hypothetical protein
MGIEVDGKCAVPRISCPTMLVDDERLLEFAKS